MQRFTMSSLFTDHCKGCAASCRRCAESCQET
ncbi:MAG: four-helix bundle copper-binding protein [Nostoc sp. NMS9]|nr:four-helix bundle copper-binding protein [Nostoc sp. NMS9]